MRNFLENTLKQYVTLTEDHDIHKELPLVFKARYTVYKAESNGILWMAIEPKKEVSLTDMRKSWQLVEKITQLNCALFLHNTTFYIREKLLEEGIPFVLENKQIYLPFMGYLLSKGNTRKIPPVRIISFLTQKMVLMAIYEKWAGIKVSEAAVKLGVSKKSASRCYDEIEYLNIDILSTKGKSRVISIPNDLKKLWSDIRNKLRSPVIRVFDLAKDVGLDKKAALSSLCEYSLLSDDKYPTYAITKKEIADSYVKSVHVAGCEEEIACRVVELGYYIDFNNKGNQDPLSVILSLTKEEMEDERISISIEKMLEDYVWSKSTDIKGQE